MYMNIYIYVCIYTYVYIYIYILKLLDQGAGNGGGIRCFRSTFSSLASTPLAERTRVANSSSFLGQVSAIVEGIPYGKSLVLKGFPGSLVCKNPKSR